MNKYIYIVVSVLLIGLLVSGVGLAQGLDMEFKQAPLGDVFQILGEIAGYNVLIDPSVEGVVSFYLKDLSVKEALDLISRTTGYGYEVVNNTLIVASNQRLQAEFASAEFVFLGLKNVNVTAANQLVTVVVPSIKTYSDLEHNLIVLYGAKDQVGYAKSLLEQYDSISQGFWPASKGTQAVSDESSNLNTYRLPITYGNGETILRSIQRLFPLRDFTWNDELKMITAITTPEEWLQVEKVIVEQDLPDFTIKGIVADGAKTLVLVDYNGTTTLVELGGSLVGWVLIDISGKDVVFSQEQRKFVVGMGR